MITINGKTFRNLQEQVYYLSNLIGDATDIVKNVVGTVTSPSALPAYTSVNYGTTYAVGASSPYNYYVATSSGWVNLGMFPKAGPSGTDGKDGNSIFLTSANLTPNTDYIYTRDIYNPSNLAYKAGDLILATNASGDYLYTVSNVRSSDVLDIVYRTTLSGIQGPKGDTGPQGPKGDTGPQGPKGDTGTSADVVAIDFPHGQETVTYDTTDGITMTGQTRLTDSAGETNDVATDISIPIFPGSNVNIDAKDDGTGVVISATGGTGDYVEKTSNGLKVYATDDIGNQTTVDYTNDILADSIPLRNASGNLAGNAPTTGNDYTPKIYVDTAVSGKLDKQSGASERAQVYVKDASGKQQMRDIYTTATSYTIPYRDGNGIVYTNTPTSTSSGQSCINLTYFINAAEAWTFTLDDGSTVVKNVLVNTATNTTQGDVNLYDVDAKV